MGPNPPFSCGASTTYGHHSGKLYCKQRNLVTNSFDVDAELLGGCYCLKANLACTGLSLWRQLPTAINIYNDVSNHESRTTKN